MADNLNLLMTVSADVKQLVNAMNNAKKAANDTGKAVENSFNGAGPAADRAAQQVTRSMQQIDRQTQQVTRNLSFQLNDITQGLLSGTSPFTIMAQQTSQIVQAFDGLDKGVSKVGALIGGLRSILSWQTLVTGAVIYGTAAAVQYFTSSEDGAEKTNELLKQQDELIRDLAEAYGVSMDALERYEQRSVAVLTRLATLQREAFAVTSQSALTDVQQTVRGYTPADLGNNLNEITKLNIIVETLRRNVAAGKGGFIEFSNSLAQLAQSTPYPEMKKLADELRENVGEAAGAEAKIDALNAVMDGTASAAENAAEGSEKFIEKLRELKEIAPDALSDAEQAMKIYDEAMRQAGLTARDRVAAYHELQEALERLNIKEQAEHQKRFNEAMKALKPPLSEAEQLMTKFATALAEANGWQEKLTATTGFFQNIGAAFSEKWAEGAKEYSKSISDAADLIRKQESFREQAYPDTRTSTKKFDAWRVGYGSDTFMVGKQIKTVMADTVVTIDQAEADLERRIAEFQTTIMGQIGPNFWQSFNEKQQAALTSIAYNYGNLPPSIVKAIKQGDHGQVEAAIRALTSNPERRQQEADVWAGGGGKAKQAADLDKWLAKQREAIELKKQENQIDLDQTATINQKNAAKEEEKLYQEGYNAALAQYGTVSAQQREAIRATAHEMAQLGLTTADAKTAQDAFTKSSEENRKAQEAYAQAVTGIAKTAVSGFVNDLRNGVAAGDAFRNMLDRVIDGMINMAIESLFAKNALGGIFSTLSGGTGSGLSFFPAAPTMKGGGTVGFSNHSSGKRYSPALWRNAPSMGGGGIVGDPNAIPIIAHRGEIVVPTTARRGGSGAGVVDNSTVNLGNVQVDVSTGAVTASNENSRELGLRINRAVQAVMVAESRPGGLLRRVPG